MDEDERLARQEFIRSERERSAADAQVTRDQLAARLAEGPPIEDQLTKWRRQQDEATDREAQREDVRRRVADRIEQRNATRAAELVALEGRLREELGAQVLQVARAVNATTTAVEGALGRIMTTCNRLSEEQTKFQADMVHTVSDVVEKRLHSHPLVDVTPEPVSPAPRPRPRRPDRTSGTLN